MRITRLTTDEMMYPVELIETHGPSQEEVKNTTLNSYFELLDNVLFALEIEDGVALLIFVTYVLYHVISKLRGNEKNAHMNQYGVALAVLVIASYSVWFSDDVARTLDND